MECHRQPLVRRPRREGDAVAVDLRRRGRLVDGVVRAAELLERLLAQCGARQGRIGESGEQVRRQVVGAAAPAVRAEIAGVDPLHVDDAAEDRQDVVAEADVGGGQPGTVERVPAEARRVVGGDQAGAEPGAVVRRRHDDPPRLGLQRAPADRHRRQHRAVTGVVRPSVVVGERCQRRLTRRVAATLRREEHEAPELVGEQLAERHGLVEEAPSVQGDRCRRRPADRSLAGGDHQSLAIGAGHVRVAPLHGDGHGEVHRPVEVVPSRLLVGDAHRPRDVGVGSRDLPEDGTARVVAEDAEACRLAGDRTGGVLEATGRDRERPGQLGTEEEAVGAVADAGDADRRVDGDRRPRLPADRSSSASSTARSSAATSAARSSPSAATVRSSTVGGVPDVGCGAASSVQPASTPPPATRAVAARVACAKNSRRV